jgi:long-chain acyl-CoA synthetase
VYGNSYKSSIIGIIVPEETVLFEWARDNNQEQDMKILCSNSEVKKFIMDDLEKQAKNGDLKGFEKVKIYF